MDPNAPPRKLVHVERFPIFWGDMDALGHVNTLYEMRRVGDSHVHAEGSAVVVFIDGASQRAIAIPPQVRSRLEALPG